MKLDEVRKIGIVGGGVMGGGIGQVMAIAGYQVLIRDLTPEILARTRETILETRFGLKRAVEIGKLPAGQLEPVVANLFFTTDLRDLRDCDFIIEAVPERLELKQAVFAELDGIVKPEAVFTSNTSGFVIQDVARDVSEARKALFAGMHFASPAPVMKMCEVVYTPQTSPETVETVRGLAERAGKVVSMVRDTPGTYGFILNRVFAAARREAQKIVEDGIATPEDVDKAMMNGRNWPSAFFNDRARSGWL